MENANPSITALSLLAKVRAEEITSGPWPVFALRYRLLESLGPGDRFVKFFLHPGNGIR